MNYTRICIVVRKGYSIMESFITVVHKISSMTPFTFFNEKCIIGLKHDAMS